MTKYRFIDTEKEHLHQIFDENLGDWQNLTGTSSVIEVLGKPLTWWASGKAVEALGWLRPDKDRKTLEIRNEKERLAEAKKGLARISKMSGKEFLELLDSAYRAHNEVKEKAREEGTGLHERLELAVKIIMSGARFTGSPEPKVMEFVKWAEENVKRFLWSEMNCFSYYHFIGGISDAGAELKDGSIALIDFKSSREAYFSHFVQCGGYDIQIAENGGYSAEGEKILTLEKPITKYIVFPFGAKKIEPETVSDTEGFRRAFLGALAIYREKGLFEKPRV
jgi:hypothetical protein